MAMKLYLGSRNYKPQGFLTVDIDPTHKPDIVADVTALARITSGSVSEICASHILEHLAWPLAFKALGEWARVLQTGGVLRVAIPDLGALAQLIADGRNAWAAAGLLFGVGRLEAPLEAHQYGYTRGMMLSMLRVLGFGQFDWWKHDLPDASNGWMVTDAGDRVAISLNIAATKLSDPLYDVEQIYRALHEQRLAPFDQVVSNLISSQDTAPSQAAEQDPLLAQRLHMMLIEARMRILYLENEMQARPARAAR